MRGRDTHHAKARKGKTHGTFQSVQPVHQPIGPEEPPNAPVAPAGYTGTDGTDYFRLETGNLGAAKVSVWHNTYDTSLPPTFAFSSDSPVVEIYGKGGDDIIEIRPFPSAFQVEIDGGTGSNKIMVQANPASSVWTIDDYEAGNLNQNVKCAHVQWLYGNPTVADRFVMMPNASLSGGIWGTGSMLDFFGKGATLDYSNWTTPVTVNVEMWKSQASGIRRTDGFAIAGIREVVGGHADDILQGSQYGGVVLQGGPGNDLLRGGFAADQLFGDGDNDILVGGVGQE